MSLFQALKEVGVRATLTNAPQILVRTGASVRTRSTVTGKKNFKKSPSLQTSSFITRTQITNISAIYLNDHTQTMNQSGG